MKESKMSVCTNHRIKYLYATKGIACLGVFVHHLFISFLPATYSGLKSDSKIEFDYLLGSSPLGLFTNGNFWVCLFLLISAFILSKNVFDSKGNGKKHCLSIAKRYPRLMLPVLCVNILGLLVSYVLFSCGLNVDKVFNMSFLNLIKISLFDIWFTENVHLMGYWMMSILFYGSLVAIILSAIANHIKKPIFVRLFLISSLCILMLLSTYYFATILGISLAYEANRIKVLQNINRPIKYISVFVLALLFILFAGYPSSGLIYSGAYSWANYLPVLIRNAPQMFHIVAAYILIFVLAHCQMKLQQ